MKRYTNYSVWRKQQNSSGSSEWILTGHKLKAQSHKDAQSRMRRGFASCGFAHMSMVALPEGVSLL